MRLKSVLREPLLHFLVLGAALFLYYHWTSGGPDAASSRIVIGAGQVEHLVANFAKARQRMPTDAELKGLLDDWVREELAVREAMAMGLDRDDTIIRRRLKQKLEFLVEDVAATQAPTDAELQAWLVAHPEGFRIAPKLALRQVALSRERRGPAAEAEARALLARLQAEGAVARIDELGDLGMLPQEVALSSLDDIARTFGDDFAARVETLTPGTWTGPIESGYGLHLVLVREHRPGSLPELAAVRTEVEPAYLADRRARQLDAMYERLLEKHSVVIEQPAATPDAAKGGR